MDIKETDYTDLHTWLESYVNSRRFTTTLESTILAVENPSQRARLLLDLVDYIKPKYKTVDAPSINEAKEIHVTYVMDNTEK